MKALSLLTLLALAAPAAAADPLVLDLWPGKPPGETKVLPPEQDINKPEDKPVGDRKIIKLTNVSKPTLAVYRPAKEKDTGAAIIVCPGGGHRILAYDHEGTEAAEWLAKVGVTGVVLKYRVPARDENKRWLAAVQDAQRAVSLVRSKAAEWGIDPKRVGILGFSAGGETAALTAILHKDRQYTAADKVDEVSARPDFAALIYPGGLLEKGNEKLRDYAIPSKDTLPMFLVHAFDDPVDARNSLLMAVALKQVGVSSELHVFATGGHGYGMRSTGHPVNHWPQRCEEWLARMGYLKK
jgi:acetyl esterase/lipase